jgi:thioredoxin 1
VGALAEASEDRVRFYNLEAGPNLQFLADLGVSGLPTFLFYKDGNVKGSLSGRNILLDEISAETEKLLR